MEKVQKRGFRICVFSQIDFNYEQSLKMLNMLSLHARCAYNRILMCYKMKNNLVNIPLVFQTENITNI